MRSISYNYVTVEYQGAHSNMMDQKYANAKVTFHPDGWVTIKGQRINNNGAAYGEFTDSYPALRIIQVDGQEVPDAGSEWPAHP